MYSCAFPRALSFPVSLLFSISGILIIAGSSTEARAYCQVPESELGLSRFQRISNLTSQANKLYQEKEYEQSKACYLKALNLGAEDKIVAFNAACCAALSRSPDEAFGLLQDSLNFGWIDTRKLKSDSDLKSLHSDERWPALIEQCRQITKSIRTRWNSNALKTPFAENISTAEKVAGLSAVWSEVKFNFANFDQVPELDWDQAYMEAMPRVIQSKSTLEYFRELKRMVAKLKDGHTNVYLPSQLKSHEARVGIQTRLIEDKVIIVRVTDKAISDNGIKTGMEIVEVDGAKVKDHASKLVEPFVCASTDQDRVSRIYGSSLLTGPLDAPVQLKIIDDQGVETTRTIKRKSSFRSNLSWLSKPSLKLKVLDGNVGYIALNTFGTNLVATQFATAFNEVQKTDGLILDLRNNSGGNSGVGWEILSYLTDKPFQTTKWHTLQYRPTLRAWGLQPISRFGSQNEKFDRVKKDHYRNPVVLLVGPKTFSAAEDMAAAFDMLNRGKIIGEPTGGSTGQPLFFNLPGGGKARVCTKHDSYADGTEFVGKGIQPDIVVSPTIEDVRNGKDTILKAALKILNSKSNGAESNR